MAKVKDTSNSYKSQGRPKGSITKNNPKRTRSFKCLRCGINVVQKIKAGTPQKFCSGECRELYQKETKSRFIFKTCEVCGKRFQTQNHGSRMCSMACTGIKRSEKNKLNRPTFYCKKCGKPFFRNQKPTESRLYCSRKCAGVGEMGKGSSNRFASGGTHRQRAKRFGVEYEPIRILDVFNRDGWHCQICGKSTPEKNRGSRYSNAPELDHRVPMSKGGNHLYSNVQCACRSCNVRKSNNRDVGQLPLFGVGAVC